MTIYNVLAGRGTSSYGPNLYVANRRRTLMLLGDSITWGWNVLQYQTYAKKLQERIDTVVAGGANTDEWVARNVQADDIISRDAVTTKLQNGVGLSYDNLGPFESSYVPGYAVNPAILFDAKDDRFQVTPSSLQNPVQYLTLMVKVTGSGSATIEVDGLTALTGTLASVGGSNIGVNNVYRFIYDSTSGTTSFTVRRTDTAGGALARILSVNPTNLYPQSGVGNFGTTGYINVQINARGSYVFADYSNDMASIHESVIFPLTDTATLIADPIYVIALGTVNMYFNSPTFAPLSGDRRIIPSSYGTELNTLISAIRAVSPNSPIYLTHPPIPYGSYVTLPDEPRAKYDAVIQSVAISNGLPVIDLRSTLSPNTTDYSDELHPTVVGQGKLANTYIEALRL
jgi:hypothetical protein